MKVEDVKVSSEKKVVAIIQVEQFDGLEEARKFLGDDRCLHLINIQHKTLKMNDTRNAYSGKPSKKSLREKAELEILDECCAGAHPQVRGNSAALQDLITQRMAKLEADALAARPVILDDDEENEE